MKQGNIMWQILERMIRWVIGGILGLFNIKWDEFQWQKFMQFVQFCMVGLSSAVVMYIFYVITWHISQNYFIANLAGFVFSTMNSFFWNSRYVFHLRNEGFQVVIVTYLKTLALYAITGLIISNLLLYLWVDMCGISELLAPIINVLIVTPLNFMLNKLWAFKEK